MLARANTKCSILSAVSSQQPFARIDKKSVFSKRRHMESNTAKSKRGGARPGAGRPVGSLNKRSVAAIEKVAEQFPDWSPLQHFATIANDETLDPSIRLDAAKAAAPFIHPRPKPVELDPAALVDLERQLVQVRLTAQDQILHSKPGLSERLARAKERIVVVTGISRAPDEASHDEPIDDLSERLAERLAAQRLSPPEGAPATPSAGPEPARAAAPVPEAPAAAPEPPPAPAPYRPITPEPAPLRFSQTMDPNYRPLED